MLPFANLGGDPQQDYFVDGVTESLTTDLSRIAGSFVIGRHTAFTYKGNAVDLKQIGRQLNIRYVLEGSVQRSSDRLRVNTQLVDAASGSHLWADRFDNPIVDLFDMQDEIVSRLANTLNAQLIEAEARRGERLLHPDAVDLYFQGMACFNRGPTNEHMLQARRFFERALVLDPKNVEALIGIANVDADGAGAYRFDDRAARFAQAEAAVLNALSIAPQHATAHMQLGFIQIQTNRATQGIAECERALTLDQNLASAHAWVGLAKLFMGRSAETELHIIEALRLSPRDISTFRWMNIMGIAKLHLSADAEAVRWQQKSIEANRNASLVHFCLATSLALLGQVDQARAAVQSGLGIDPEFTIRRYRAGASSDNPTYLLGRERMIEGMRLAGIPEG